MMSMAGLKLPLLIGILLFISPEIFGQQSIDNRGRNGTGEETTSRRKCLEVDPQSQCPDKNIFFTLYSRRVDKAGVNISAPASSFPDIFKPTDAIKVVIHGIIVDYMTPELYDIKDDFIKKSDCHVVFVHYEPYAASLDCYTEALLNLKHVGRCIAQLLAEFISNVGIKDIHVLTYSLGGHLASYVALALKPYKLPRITALDPPNLLVPEEHKLDPSDAQFVDIIVTSALSLGTTSGHAAFYFNGGLIQPGCILGLCSHSRAVDYYKESILSPVKFYAVPCENYLSYLLGLCGKEQIVAGDVCPRTAKGMYAVNTNDHFPFAQGRRRNARLTSKKSGKQRSN